MMTLHLLIGFFRVTMSSVKQNKRVYLRNEKTFFFFSNKDTMARRCRYRVIITALRNISSSGVHCRIEKLLGNTYLSYQAPSGCVFTCSSSYPVLFLLFILYVLKNRSMGYLFFAVKCCSLDVLFPINKRVEKLQLVNLMTADY